MSFTVPHELVLDDFNDGELDGWILSDALENAGFGTMIHDASTGELRIATESPMKHGLWDHAVLEETEGDALYANGIIRAVVSAEDGTSAVLNIRTSLSEETTTGAEGGYWIGLEPIGGTISIVNFIDQYQNENPGVFPGIVDFEPIGFEANTRYLLEVIADGENISATAWPLGLEKPINPQVTMHSAEILGGGIGFSTSHGPDAPAVRNHAGLFDDLTFEQLMPGDFDNNKAIDAADIDLLTSELHHPSQRRIFDMNNDGVITDFDHTFLVTTLGGFTLGDANLNGEVEFTDFLALAENFGNEGGWTDGNFNADRLVDFKDFLLLANNFSSAADAAAASVPEPNTGFLWLLGLMGTVLPRTKRVSSTQQHLMVN